MPSGLKRGDEVLVAASRLGLDRAPHAVVSREVLRRSGRSALVDTQDGQAKKIATRFLQRDFGILLIRAGDLTTETSTLDPLFETVRSHLQLLLPEDRVSVIRLRTRDELRHRWAQAGGVTHVLWIGHSDGASLRLLDEWVGAEDLLSDLGGLDKRPRQFLFLSCKAGRAAFARPFSSSPLCEVLIAPFQDVHAAVMAQFALTYLSFLLVAGEDAAHANRHAQEGLPRGSHFRIWRGGNRLIPRARNPKAVKHGPQPRRRT